MVVTTNAINGLAVNVPITNWNSTNLVFYWVDGTANATVSCDLGVNGTTVPIAAAFDVRKPTANWFAKSNAPIALTNDMLTFGVPDPHTAAGIFFIYSDLDLQGYTNAYTMSMVQLLSGSAVVAQGASSNGQPYTVTLTPVGSGPALDERYPTYSWGSAILESGYDAPGTPSICVYQYEPIYSALNAISDNMSCMDYLYFQPAGPSSIPVALRQLNWSVSMAAVRTQTNQATVDTITQSNVTYTSSRPVSGNPTWSAMESQPSICNKTVQQQ